MGHPTRRRRKLQDAGQKCLGSKIAVLKARSELAGPPIGQERSSFWRDYWVRDQPRVLKKSESTGFVQLSFL